MTEVRDELRRELERITDRLGSMPLARASGCADDVHATAAVVVEMTGEHPAEDLPRLAPQGLAALIAVVGRDYLQTPEDDERDRLVRDRLAALRRALP